MFQNNSKGSVWALLPLFVFIGVFLITSIILGDFYKMPVLVAFVLASLIGFLQFPNIKFEDKITTFCLGAGNPIIMLMLLIFLLAGAFAALANHIGAIDSIINLSLTFISPRLFIAGLFLIAAFVSTSIGTSMGTIVALAPIAAGLEESIAGTLGISLAAVVGGAMFGDNLSFISDTTIAAAKTQDISLSDKFKANFRIVIIPAILAFFIYVFGVNFKFDPSLAIQDYSLISIIPYLLVFIIAVLGVNVIWALVIGIISTYLIGVFLIELSIWDALATINSGMATMFELSLICVVIGGMVGMIRNNGGIDYLLYQVTKRIKSERGAEFGIAGLTSIIDVAIANNTITIIITGPIAKEIVYKYGLDPKRSASIMDTMACTIQGFLPYGGQILAVMAISAYQVTPWEIIQHMYYPFLVGFVALCTIYFKKHKLRH